jgi:hypothetical protein
MFPLVVLTLTLPFVLPSTWPSTGAFGISCGLLGDAQGLGGGKMQLIGPSDLIGDATQYGRVTAAQLMTYQTLVAGWDGGNADAPSSRAIGNALRMLEIAPRGIEAPKPMLLPSGEVALYWDFGDAFAEIGFDDTGVYYAFASRPGFASVHLDDVPFDDEGVDPEFPARLREILTWAPLRAAA